MEILLGFLGLELGAMAAATRISEERHSSVLFTPLPLPPPAAAPPPKRGEPAHPAAARLLRALVPSVRPRLDFAWSVASSATPVGS